MTIPSGETDPDRVETGDEDDERQAGWAGPTGDEDRQDTDWAGPTGDDGT